MTTMALGPGTFFGVYVSHGDAFYDMLPSNWIVRNALLFAFSAILICLGGASVLASASGSILG